MKDNFNLEIDVQEPPVIAVRLANLLFFLGFIISALIVLYVTYKIINPANVLLNSSVRLADIHRSVNGYDNYPSNTRDYIYLIIAVITSSIFALGAILRNHLKVNLSILFLTTGLALYSIELYLTLSFNNDHKNYILDAQEKNDSKWDHRNLYEVIEDLKKSTNDNSIYPHYNSGGLIFTSYLQNLIDDKELDRIRVEANGLHPLSNNSNSTIVHCNENGIWHNFKTDKYGFSNPAKIIQNINAININKMTLPKILLLNILNHSPLNILLI